MKQVLLNGWYLFWKLTASIGLKMYFSSLQVNGLKNVPKRGPIILAVNHQNSFLDAIIVACILPRKSFFLARGDVFKKKWAYSLLSSIGIMPIFRTRDGLGKVKDNSAIFEACSKILNAGGAVMIFPEGNHYMRWSLRLLQRGVARIAFQAQEVHRSSPVKIVPVGLQYEEHMEAASRILIQIGDPIDTDTYKAVETSDQRTKMDLLLHDLELAMKSLILHVPEDGYENYVEKLRAARGYFQDQVEQLRSDQEIIDALVRNETIETKQNFQSKSLVEYLLYPLIPFGWITHILPRLIISGIVKTKVKDPQFIAPLNFALGLVIYPINAFLWSVLAALTLNLYAGFISFFVVMVIGKLTLRFWH